MNSTKTLKTHAPKQHTTNTSHLSFAGRKMPEERSRSLWRKTSKSPSEQLLRVISTTSELITTSERRRIGTAPLHVCNFFSFQAWLRGSRRLSAPIQLYSLRNVPGGCRFQSCCFQTQHTIDVNECSCSTTRSW